MVALCALFTSTLLFSPPIAPPSHPYRTPQVGGGAAIARGVDGPARAAGGLTAANVSGLTQVRYDDTDSAGGAAPAAKAKDDIHLEIAAGYTGVGAFYGGSGYFIHGPQIGLGLHVLHRGKGKLVIGGGGRLQWRGGFVRASDATQGDSLSLHPILVTGDFMIGGGSQKIIGYGIMSLGAGVIVFRGQDGGGTSLSGVGPGLLVTLGGGVLGKLNDRVSLGGRAEFGALNTALTFGALMTLGIHF